MPYTHLYAFERMEIQTLLQLGCSPTEIALEMERPVCTITRELERDCGVLGRYSAIDTAAEIAMRLSPISLELARALLDTADPQDSSAGARVHEAMLALAAGDMEEGLATLRAIRETYAPLLEADVESLDPWTRLLSARLRETYEEDCDALEQELDTMHDLRIMGGPRLGRDRDTAIIEVVEKICETGLPD